MEQHVSLLNVDDRITSMGADAVVDNRLDQFLARNAVYARFAWQHLAFSDWPSANRSQLDVRGYLGLPGPSVLVLRAVWDGSDTPLPDSEKALFGGLANVRGFKAGSAVGDRVAAGSIELRLPLSSPLRVGKIGISAFADTGAAYGAGERLADQHLRRGYGGGLWFTAGFVRASVAVAHGQGAATQIHLTGTVGL
jgi:hemolysin activation/secretion protein